MADHSIAEAVKAARIAAGLSRADVEARATLVPRTLERIELRGQEPRWYILHAIAVALGTTADDLRGVTTAPSLRVAVEGLVARHGVRAVLDEAVRLV